MFLSVISILCCVLVSNQHVAAECYRGFRECFGSKQPVHFDKSAFWVQTRKGATVFNYEVTSRYLAELRKRGIQLIRLAPNNWRSVRRDFLIGDADQYTGIPERDFQKLKYVLNRCEKVGIKVILVMLSLPGCRWTPHNNHCNDTRIYEDPSFQNQAAQFYKELAFKLSHNRTIVAYDLLNEPNPEGLYADDEGWDGLCYRVQQAAQRKLRRVYQMCIRNIRSVDTETPIIVEPPCYADPRGFIGFRSFRDPNIIYSFHMYQPATLTNYSKNQGWFKYPGTIGNRYWGKAELVDYMSTVEHFQEVYEIPSHRILLGEFGGHRETPGLGQYFSHLIEYCKSCGYHALFYTVLPDECDSMDYEVGSENKGAKMKSKEAWQVLQEWLLENAVQ